MNYCGGNSIVSSELRLTVVVKRLLIMILKLMMMMIMITYDDVIMLLVIVTKIELHLRFTAELTETKWRLNILNDEKVFKMPPPDTKH